MIHLQSYLDTYARKILLNKRFFCFNKFVVGKKHDTGLLSTLSASTDTGHCNITGFSYKHQIFCFHFFRPWKDEISLEK